MTENPRHNHLLALFYFVPNSRFELRGPNYNLDVIIKIFKITNRLVYSFLLGGKAVAIIHSSQSKHTPEGVIHNSSKYNCESAGLHQKLKTLVEATFEVQSELQS